MPGVHAVLRSPAAAAFAAAAVVVVASRRRNLPRDHRLRKGEGCYLYRTVVAASVRELVRASTVDPKELLHQQGKAETKATGQAARKRQEIGQWERSSMKDRCVAVAVAVALRHWDLG